MEAEDRNESLDGPSRPKCVLGKELDCGDEPLGETSVDRRRTPTAPTSRLIAPMLAAGLESGEGTCTGSEDEEYTPATELLDKVADRWESFVLLV